MELPTFVLSRLSLSNAVCAGLIQLEPFDGNTVHTHTGQTQRDYIVINMFTREPRLHHLPPIKPLIREILSSISRGLPDERSSKYHHLTNPACMMF